MHRRLWSAFIGAAMPAPALWAVEPLQVIERFAGADRLLSYRIVLAVSDSRPPQIIERVHTAPGTDQLVLLSEPQRAPLAALAAGAPLIPIDERLTLLRQAYSIEVADPVALVRRSAVPVRFRSKDGLRYNTTLWLDQDSGIPLKSQVFDIDGRLLEHSVASELEILQRGVATDAASATPTLWQVRPLPAGFVLYSVQRSGDREQQYFFDGLAGMSMFVERASGQPGGVSRTGALSTLVREDRGYRLTAVGGVPLVTLERLLNAATLAAP